MDFLEHLGSQKASEGAGTVVGGWNGSSLPVGRKWRGEGTRQEGEKGRKKGSSRKESSPEPEPQNTSSRMLVCGTPAPCREWVTGWAHLLHFQPQ